MWIVIGRSGWPSHGSTKARPMDLELILTPGLGNGSFLIASGRDAVVVDPPRDAWRVLAAAEARGWRVTHVLETHVHNDYLSGALELAIGRRSRDPRAGARPVRVRPPTDGRHRRPRGRRAPAHRACHARSYTGAPRLGGRATDGRHGPAAVATGGSLLVGSAGPDRPPRGGPDRRPDPSPVPLPPALAALPDDVAILPTHGAGSFCSVGPADADADDDDRSGTPVEPAAEACTDETSFRAALLDGLGPYPTLLRGNGADQSRRAAVVGQPARSRRDRTRCGPERGRRRGAHRRCPIAWAFAAGHVGGSLNIELGESFASYVGWFVPFGAAVVLVLPEPVDDALVEATTQLFRIGYDRDRGCARGWVERGRCRRHDSVLPVVSAAPRHGRTREGRGPHLLDVRYPYEWRDDGKVPGSIELSIGDLPIGSTRCRATRRSPSCAVAARGRRSRPACSTPPVSMSVWCPSAAPRYRGVDSVRRTRGRAHPDAMTASRRPSARRAPGPSTPPIRWPAGASASSCRPAPTGGPRRISPGCRSAPSRSRPARRSSARSTAGRLGVEGWFESGDGWLGADRAIREMATAVVGARPDGGRDRNTLTINLHLLLAGFYRPDGSRPRSSSTPRPSRRIDTPSTRTCVTTARIRPTT